MNEAKKLKIFDLKVQISELHAEIKDLQDGCGSWFQPDGAPAAIQCGHGFGHCPACDNSETGDESGESEGG
ncbi:MAG: hypothetical protein V3V08_05590 [Nannocystaceae bacterium]